MAGFMRTAFPSMDEYDKQIKNYDAGRPTTPTSTKPGSDVHIPEFDPSADAKNISTRTPLLETNQWTQDMASAYGAKPQNPSYRPMMTKVQPGFDPSADTKSLNPSAQPVASNVSPINGGKFDPSTGAKELNSSITRNAFAGKYSADGVGQQGIYQDPVTGRKSITLTGDAGREFMSARTPLTTARPGEGTMSSSPAPVERAPLSSGASPMAGAYGYRDTAAMDDKLFAARLNQIKNSDAMSKPGSAWGDMNQKQLEDFQNKSTQATGQRLANELDNTRLSAAATGQQLPSERNASMSDSVERVRRSIDETRAINGVNANRQSLLAQQGMNDENTRSANTLAAAERKDLTDRYVADRALERSMNTDETNLKREAVKEAASIKKAGDPSIKAKWDGYSKAYEALVAAQDPRLNDEKFQRALKAQFGLTDYDVANNLGHKAE